MEFRLTPLQVTTRAVALAAAAEVGWNRDRYAVAPITGDGVFCL
jgi:hypothetical protein